MIEKYPAFGKIPRWYRDIFITEKIDGTNGQIFITPTPILGVGSMYVTKDNLLVYAGSRNRWLSPESDNYGFARWAYDNAEALSELLGHGRHYGEWWGSGIQRKYGLDEKRFSLFNVHRWEHLDGTQVPGLHAVPALYRGPNHELAVSQSLDELTWKGSRAAPGFMHPEGIVIYHTAGGGNYKVTLENDEAPKTAVPKQVNDRERIAA